MIRLSAILFVLLSSCVSPSPKEKDKKNVDATQEVKPSKPAVITYSGTSAEIGKQQGQQQAEVIRGVIQQWLEPRFTVLRAQEGGSAFIKAYGETIKKFTSRDLLQEVQAMAEMSQVPFETLLIANASADLFQLVGAGNFVGCSTIAIPPQLSENSGMLIGRNLDYDQSELLRQLWQPVVFAKTGKLKIFSIHVAGLSGVLTGINERGVHLAIKVSTGETTRFGTPSSFIFREVLENAKTAREALNLYRTYKQTVALNVLISDDREAFELEIDANKSYARPLVNSEVLFGANHFDSKLMRKKAGVPDARWPKLQSFATKQGKYSFEDLRNIITTVGGFDAEDASSNVLATFVDYGRKEISFGSDPAGKGKSGAGPLYTYKFSEIF
jgi:predicted choloylglycine hydrolase